MKTENNAHAPAFPQPANCGDRIKDGKVQLLDAGMTLREYYAGLAMQGMLANEASSDLDFKILAAGAVIAADQLCAELAK